MLTSLWYRALCLLTGCAAAVLSSEPAPVADAATEIARRSNVLEKRFVLSSPAANAYTVSTDASFLITFIFNMLLLGTLAVAVAGAAHQTAVASSRRQDRPAPLERRSSPARVRRRPGADSTLAPDTVQAIVEHVNDPPPTAATDADTDSPSYERYPSRYDEDTGADGPRFQPSTVADILDYLYETDRTLYDELQARVAHRPPPPAPARGAKDGEYAEYLASVYGYARQKADRDGYARQKADRDGYSAQQADWDGYSGQQADRGGLSGQDADLDGWQTDQESAQASYRTPGNVGLSGTVAYADPDDLLGPPLKFRRR